MVGSTIAADDDPMPASPKSRPEQHGDAAGVVERHSWPNRRTARGSFRGESGRGGSDLPAQHPVLHPVRVVVEVDRRPRRRAPAAPRAGAKQPVSAHSSAASAWSTAARASGSGAVRAARSASSKACARSSRWPGAFSVRRARAVAHHEVRRVVTVAGAGATASRCSATRRPWSEATTSTDDPSHATAARQAARRSATGSSSPAYSGSSASAPGHQHHPGRSLQPPDRPLRRAAAGDGGDHVDGLPGLDDLVHAVDAGAGQRADRGRGEGAGQPLADRAGRATPRRSPCWTARPAPASRCRPSRRGAG